MYCLDIFICSNRIQYLINNAIANANYSIKVVITPLNQYNYQ